MSMIHSSCVPVGRSDSEIWGSAKLSTVLSTDTSSTGSMSTASANQRPAAPRAGPRVAGLVLGGGPGRGRRHGGRHGEGSFHVFRAAGATRWAPNFQTVQTV